MRKGGERHAAVTRLPFSILQRSPVSGLRQTKKQKKVGVKRVETIGVYPLAPRRGYGAPAGQASSVRFASDHSTKCEHFVKPVDIAE